MRIPFWPRRILTVGGPVHPEAVKVALADDRPVTVGRVVSAPGWMLLSVRYMPGTVKVPVEVVSVDEKIHDDDVVPATVRAMTQGLDAVRPSCPECGRRGWKHYDRCCAKDIPQPGSCTVLPNGQGPACDWDADCPDHGLRSLAWLDDQKPDRSAYCFECKRSVTIELAYDDGGGHGLTCSKNNTEHCAETDEVLAHDTTWSGPCANGTVLCTLCGRTKPGTAPNDTSWCVFCVAVQWPHEAGCPTRNRV